MDRNLLTSSNENFGFDILGKMGLHLTSLLIWSTTSLIGLQKKKFLFGCYNRLFTSRWKYATPKLGVPPNYYPHLLVFHIYPPSSKPWYMSNSIFMYHLHTSFLHVVTSYPPQTTLWDSNKNYHHVVTLYSLLQHHSRLQITVQWFSRIVGNISGWR